MKKGLALLATLFCLAAANAHAENATTGATAPHPAKALTADEIMQKMDNRKEPSDMVSEMSMILTDKKGKTNERSVLTARKGKDYTIMWFLSPADVKGSSFLSIAEKGKSSMWIYLPYLGKVAAISSHGNKRKGHFMGSDFTYEDLEGRKYEDYSFKLLGSEKLGDRDCYKIESLPKEHLKNPSYGKVISWVWKENFFALKEAYYDKMLTLTKVQLIEKLKRIKNYWMPEFLTMENVTEKKKHSTIIEFKNILVDQGIDEGIFHQKSLTRIFNKNALYKKKPATKKETTIKKEEK